MKKERQQKLRDATEYENFRVAALQIEVQAIWLTNISRRVGLLPADPPENWRAQKEVYVEKLDEILNSIRAFIET